jgi:hypothetical protein
MIQPHPPLLRFYGDSLNRERFVRGLFDGTAPWLSERSASRL